MLDIFIYQVEIDGQSRGYETYSWQVIFANGGQILWGDGTQEVITASSTSQYYPHTYNAKGIYIVVLIGATEFYRAPGVWLKRVLTPFPSAVVRVRGMFYECYYLETIPDGLLINANNGGNSSFLSDYENFMAYCIRLQNIPDDLFAYHSPIYINNAFRGAGEWYYRETGELIEMPMGLLRGCNILRNASSAFDECYFDEIPPGFLNDCESLRMAASMFSNYRGSVIPEGLFDNCPDLYTAAWMFFHANKVESIPETLFDNCPGITTFESAFEDCQSVHGKVPELWLSHPNANGTECFANMIAAYITNYADIPSDWK